MSCERDHNANNCKNKITSEMIDADLVVHFLARALHWKMEQLDPSDLPEWDAMNDCQKHIFIQCIVLLRQEVCGPRRGAG
jgi:hypothetical protein